jgi:hypothetical protein
VPGDGANLVAAVGTVRWMRNRRRRARWVVGTLAGLVLVCFLTFDVLDLDGSNLARGTRGEAVALEAVGSDVERMCVLAPHSLMPSGVQRNAVLSLSHPPPHPSHASPVSSQLRLRFGTALPRSRTEHSHRSASSSRPAEPA